MIFPIVLLTILAFWHIHGSITQKSCWAGSASMPTKFWNRDYYTDSETACHLLSELFCFGYVFLYLHVEVAKMSVTERCHIPESRTGAVSYVPRSVFCKTCRFLLLSTITILEVLFVEQSFPFGKGLSENKLVGTILRIPQVVYWLCLPEFQ